MSFCRKCGRKLEENERFCANCGTESHLKKMNFTPNFNRNCKNILFESTGGNKLKEIYLFIFGLILIAFALYMTIYNINGYKSDVWGNRNKPDMIEWIGVISVLFGGVICFISGIASKKSFLKIYDDHIEAKSFDIYRYLFKGERMMNISLFFEEIHGVSIQKGMIVIDSFGNKKNIYCSDCKNAESIILNQLQKYRK